MFGFITKWIESYKKKREKRNLQCESLLVRVDYVLSEEEVLFADIFADVDQNALARWKYISDDTIAALSAVAPRTLWGATKYSLLKNRFSNLKNHRRILEQHVANHNQLAQDNRVCKQIRSQADDLQAHHTDLFKEKTEFVDPERGNAWAQEVAKLQIRWNNVPDTRWQKTVEYNTVAKKIVALSNLKGNIQRCVHQHNEAVAKNRAEAAYALIGDVEGRRLDEQQLNCIVKKAHNHLVIAGAGTGKTTTVVGKIKYLLKSNQCQPEDILVLSFTNASAAEMSERIRTETGVPIHASTFHKLGLDIITKVNKIKPKIVRLDLHKFVREQLELLMRSEAYLARLGRYLLYGRSNAKSEFDFETKAEYEKYLQTNPPTTINHETVKSYGEMDIANFLNHNGIAYLYEHEYELDTRTEEHSQYYPDFYLPEYKIYIEYFGINRNGEVPAYFSDKDGENAAQVYLDTMAWKRNLHKENETTMIECFAYEKLEGTLEENLARQLETNGVVLRPKSAQEIWSQVSKDGEKVLDGVVELFVTVINLMKSNNYTIEDVRKLNGENVNRSYIFEILWLVAPIMQAYQQYLQANEEIDFNDMINIATEYVAQGKFQNPFRYVIVDEYQDISKARYRLLKALRGSCDYDLFCVGDDWQSIYRFAGSDIGFILNFAHYWGASEESKIETTYRFSQSLIEISGQFVMQNPAQKRKVIRGKANDNRFALSEVNGYTEKYAVDFMAQKLEDLPNESTVFFLGRYAFDIDMLKNSGLFDLQYNNQTGFVDVRYRKRQDLKMSFTTAHKSKGLQADYVVILNNKNSRMGFPSMIQDSPILELLLEKADNYPHAEERRLFYVALTRAKKKVILLTVKDKESVFAQELIKRYQEELEKERFTCPLCGGRLLVKEGKFGRFLGCSNYKTTGCRYTKNIQWKNQTQ